MSGGKKSFGEVVESSLQQCLVQCWQWDICPPFGSLVLVHHDVYPLIGIIYTIAMGSGEPGRLPCAYQKTLEELRAQQPHIFVFMKTTCSVLIVGYIDQKAILYTVAPQPAHIHAFISLISEDVIEQFFSTTTYIHSLFSVHGSIPLMDELVFALIKKYKQYLPIAMIQDMLHAYMILIGNDYTRMRIFTRRIQAIIA
jgi:hypothetical protein